MKQRNWQLKLAKAIQDEFGVDSSFESARESLLALIAKHCPFEPDAVYVEVVPSKPGHVWDWAAKCGAYLHAEGIRLSSHRIAAVIAHFAEPLVSIVRDAKRMHRHDEPTDDDETHDCCPRCSCDSWIGNERVMTDDDEYPPNRPGESCTCGADAWNARIDAVLSGSDGPTGGPRPGRTKPGKG